MLRDQRYFHFYSMVITIFHSNFNRRVTLQNYSVRGKYTINDGCRHGFHTHGYKQNCHNRIMVGHVNI